MRNKLTLGIETSCDETSVAVVKNGTEVLSCIISSQIDIHQKFGGVVPEVASRNHTMTILNVYRQALSEANVRIEDIDAIAVTTHPGLAGALMVGANFARGIGYAAKKPVYEINHIHGHIASNFLNNKIELPFICLVVSGGHTSLYKIDNKIELLSQTRDDACGEAFDKVSRVLGLGYPGGPAISKKALEGKNNIEFIKKEMQGLDFSYSGLKTAVINYVHNNKNINIADVCASFEHAAIAPLVKNSTAACKQFGINSLAIAGGVSANKYLRETLKCECEKNGLKFFMPELKYCGDNAAMIAAAAIVLVK